MSQRFDSPKKPTDPPLVMGLSFATPLSIAEWQDIQAKQSQEQDEERCKLLQQKRHKKIEVKEDVKPARAKPSKTIFDLCWHMPGSTDPQHAYVTPNHCVHPLIIDKGSVLNILGVPICFYSVIKTPPAADERLDYDRRFLVTLVHSPKSITAPSVDPKTLHINVNVLENGKEAPTMFASIPWTHLGSLFKAEAKNLQCISPLTNGMHLVCFGEHVSPQDSFYLQLYMHVCIEDAREPYKLELHFRHTHFASQDHSLFTCTLPCVPF